MPLLQTTTLPRLATFVEAEDEEAIDGGTFDEPSAPASRPARRPAPKQASRPAPPAPAPPPPPEPTLPPQPPPTTMPKAAPTPTAEPRTPKAPAQPKAKEAKPARPAKQAPPPKPREVHVEAAMLAGRRHGDVVSRWGELFQDRYVGCPRVITDAKGAAVYFDHAHFLYAPERFQAAYVVAVLAERPGAYQIVHGQASLLVEADRAVARRHRGFVYEIHLYEKVPSERKLKDLLRALKKRYT